MEIVVGEFGAAFVGLLWGSCIAAWMMTLLTYISTVL